MVAVGTLAACGIIDSRSRSDPAAVRPTPPPSPALASVECALPWTSQDQIWGCGTPDYDVAGGLGQRELNIVVASTDPTSIAAAMAHAWRYVDPFEDGVVWARSAPEMIDGEYDRGFLSAANDHGQVRLVFNVCTSWRDRSDGGAICAARVVFAVSVSGS
jgi:hypothetical protein